MSISWLIPKVRRRDPRGAGRFALRAGAPLLLLGLTGCQAVVLDSAGAVGKGDAAILVDSLAIMLAIVVPTIAAILGFAWWYRSSNSKARYLPEFEFSGQLEMITWSIPLLTIMLLGGVIWLGSHELDPAAPIPVAAAPLDVEVVSLDWKWLFIYPRQRVASVNRLVIPAGVPVRFRLTSASVMNAFFVPQLGSMIYTMNRMATRLNLIADQPGEYLGLSSHFSGDGFSDMRFTVEATSEDRFYAWIEATRSGSDPMLTAKRYEELAKQSANVAPASYSNVEPELFDKILNQQLPPGPGPTLASGPTHEANICTSQQAER